MPTPEPKPEFPWKNLEDAVLAFNTAKEAAGAAFAARGYAEVDEDPAFAHLERVTTGLHDALRSARCCVTHDGLVYIADSDTMVVVIPCKVAADVAWPGEER